MQERQPSRTAIGAAGYRAAHQQLDCGAIFADPFAYAILGPDAKAIADALGADASQAPARLFMAARSRFAEDCLAAAVERGVSQAVILGAGLDTFALRNPYAHLQVFEVDHPQTQAWKRARLRSAGLTVPANLTFVAVDLLQDRLASALAGAGFDLGRPAVFIWLGVVPYLDRDAIETTLRDIARIPGAEVIFDYTEPLENHPPERREAMRAMAAWTASVGEPWLSYFEPAEIAACLAGHGLTDQDDVGLGDITSRYLGTIPGPALASPGAHVIRARRPMA